MIAIPTEDSATHQPLAMEYQVLSGSQSVSATFNLETSYPWIQNGALFKPAAQQYEVVPPQLSSLPPLRITPRFQARYWFPPWLRTTSPSLGLNFISMVCFSLPKAQCHMNGPGTLCRQRTARIPSWLRAYDATGNIGTSPGVIVTVANASPVTNITMVQKTTNITSSAQKLSSTLPSPVTAGNLIVVSVSGWPNLPATKAVTDSLGNTYSLAGPIQISQGSYNAIYYTKTIKGGADTVTFRTVKAGGQILMVVAEVSSL